MDKLKRYATEHPQITSWIVLAIGMVIILIWSAKEVGFTAPQWTAGYPEVWSRAISPNTMPCRGKPISTSAQPSRLISATTSSIRRHQPARVIRFRRTFR